MLSLVLGVILGFLIYYKLIKPNYYWADRYVLHAPSWPIIGNFGGFVIKTKHFYHIILDLYKKFPNARYFGCMQFTHPTLLIKDLDLIKQIGIKEFDHFHDHLPLNTKNDDLLSKSLIRLNGENWRQMRATLSPAFTSSKMKNMYHLMAECAQDFVNHFKGKEQVAVEMKDIFSRFANDVIATTAFGIRVDSLKEPNHEFYKMGRALLSFDFVQTLKFSIVLISPWLANKLGIQLLAKDVTTYFRSIIEDNIKKRKAEGIIRPDLIYLLMEARKGQLKHDDTKEEKEEGFATVEESYIGKITKHVELTDDYIVAQALLFFIAGFETASTASCLMAHELAVNPDVQKKLQMEIDSVNSEYQGKIPYEALLSMKYLDQVISETLRMWPPALQTDRICTKEFTIQPKTSQERVLVIKKGMTVIIPIVGLHRDPQYYPEPDRFDPERFNEENKGKIVPGAYLPFGIGPRNCIGSRFALLEIKTLFFHLLTKFDIVPVDKTEIPLKISPRKINLAPKNGFNLGLRPRNLIE